MAILAAAVVSLDQWSKSWAEQALLHGPVHVVGPLNLVLTYNKGAAFSLGTGVTPVIELVAVFVVAWLLRYWGRLSASATSWAYVIGFGLLFGGAVSNLCDRFVRHHHGAVVDFIQAASWWPVFNVADVAITVGALLVAVRALFPSGSPGAGETPSLDAGEARSCRPARHNEPSRRP